MKIKETSVMKILMSSMLIAITRVICNVIEEVIYRESNSRPLMPNLLFTHNKGK